MRGKGLMASMTRSYMSCACSISAVRSIRRKPSPAPISSTYLINEALKSKSAGVIKLPTRPHTHHWSSDAIKISGCHQAPNSSTHPSGTSPYEKLMPSPPEPPPRRKRKVATK